MKKLIVLTAICCLYFQTLTVSAATTDFSGEWELEVSKSTLPEAAGIESMTLKVSQTAKEITVETYTASSVELGGGVTKQGSAVKTVVYNLDGAEKTTTLGSGVMAVTETRKAKLTADGKLSLTAARNPGMQSNETWELLNKGNTLKIVRYTETARGAMNWELYFTKKSSESVLIGTRASENSDVYRGAANADGNTSSGRMIEGGVINGKAVSFPKPSYPPAARAVRASGAVNVQVTVDEQGNVISASAVSGHPLLRQAAEQAARQAKFSPTTLNGQPIKITGVVVYNFTP